MPFDKRTLVVPEATRFEEHTIVTQGDVILADDVDSAFGLMTDARIFLGERVKVEGKLTAVGDIRADMFSKLGGDVLTQGSCYLGEKTAVEGKLSVSGDLDVGDDVSISGGFEAHGWINIRNPIPLVLYVFIYLLQLVGQGKSEEVERILKELESSGPETFLISEVFFYVPSGSVLGLQSSTVKGHLSVAPECRILGNFAVQGNARVGKGTRFHGAIRADGDVALEDRVEIAGDVVASGVLDIGNDCLVKGSIVASRVEMRQTATIEGTVQAKEGIRFLTPEYVEMRQKVRDFKAGRPDVDAML